MCTLLRSMHPCAASIMAIAVLPQRAGSPLTFRGVECKRGMQARCILAPNSQQLVRWCLNASRRSFSVKAARNGQSGPSSSSDFNLAEYIEAKVDNGVSLIRLQAEPWLIMSSTCQGMWSS